MTMHALRIAVRLLSIASALALLPLAAWGLCLSAFVSTLLTLLLSAALAARRAIISALLAAAVLVSGVIEVPLRVHWLGATARAGSLDMREQVAVAGINVLLSGASVAMGFSDFGWETAVMLSPVSIDGTCSQERLARYHEEGPAPLRIWSSDMPMRSPKLRREVKRLADTLPGSAEEGQRRNLGPVGPMTWKGSAYISTSEANRVPVALNAPTTTLEGEAVREGERWRMDLVVHLFVAYPARATFAVGPLTLEEGLFHDAPLLLHPYCGEYRFTRFADDPSLASLEPIRGPFERASTALLRAAGAGYR